MSSVSLLAMSMYCRMPKACKRRNMPANWPGVEVEVQTSNVGLVTTRDQRKATRKSRSAAVALDVSIAMSRERIAIFKHRAFNNSRRSRRVWYCLQE